MTLARAVGLLATGLVLWAMAIGVAALTCHYVRPTIVAPAPGRRL